MMKKLFGTLVCLGMWGGSIFAGPFGLSMGMTLEQVTEACGGKMPLFVDDDCYLIEPEKSHSMLEEYGVYIDEEHGLYYIKAITHDISTSSYGTEIQSAFSALESSLSKSYGNPTVRIDEVDSSSYLDDAQYWMLTLSSGGRKLATLWTGWLLPDSLSAVYLVAKADFLWQGRIILEYEFENCVLVESAEDDIL